MEEDYGIDLAFTFVAKNDFDGEYGRSALYFVHKINLHITLKRCKFLSKYTKWISKAVNSV